MTTKLQQIQPFLKEIATKEEPQVYTDQVPGLIYSCIPKKGVKTMPTGYYKTEEDAINAFYNELVKINSINNG